jgi:RimJ/RimL family protein N-acetyltransferase
VAGCQRSVATAVGFTRQDARMLAIELETERLRLRQWTRADLPALVALFADPAVWWYPLRRGFSEAETAAFLDRRIEELTTRGWGLWALERSGVLLGYTGLGLPEFLPEVMPVPEVGWRLHPDFWGNGYATEAARASLEYGFDELGLSEVVSIFQPDNVASGRVMQRLGMTLDRDTSDPKSGDALRVYRLHAADWPVNGSLA